MLYFTIEKTNIMKAFQADQTILKFTHLVQLKILDNRQFLKFHCVVEFSGKKQESSYSRKIVETENQVVAHTEPLTAQQVMVRGLDAK